MCVSSSERVVMREGWEQRKIEASALRCRSAARRSNKAGATTNNNTEEELGRKRRAR